MSARRRAIALPREGLESTGAPIRSLVDAFYNAEIFLFVAVIQLSRIAYESLPLISVSILFQQYGTSIGCIHI